MSKCGTSFSWPCRCWIFVVSAISKSHEKTTSAVVYCRIAPLPYPKIPKPAFGRRLVEAFSVIGCDYGEMSAPRARSREEKGRATGDFTSILGNDQSLDPWIKVAGYIWLYLAILFVSIFCGFDLATIFWEYHQLVVLHLPDFPVISSLWPLQNIQRLRSFLIYFTRQWQVCLVEWTCLQCSALSPMISRGVDGDFRSWGA